MGLNSGRSGGAGVRSGGAKPGCDIWCDNVFGHVDTPRIRPEPAPSIFGAKPARFLGRKRHFHPDFAPVELYAGPGTALPRPARALSPPAILTVCGEHGSRMETPMRSVGDGAVDVTINIRADDRGWGV